MSEQPNPLFDIADHRNMMSRRSLIKVGTVGFLGLSLSLTELFRMEAALADGASGAKAKSVILLWMDGGPSQYDTFDPKLDAPAGMKSELGQIKTNVPGLNLCGLMPNMAKVMDKVTLVRTVSHNEGAHERACHTLLTGWHPNPSLIYPAVGSVVAKELGSNGTLPPYVAIPGSNFAFGYGQSGYLEAAYNPFSVGGDPNNRNFTVRDVSLPNGLTVERLDDRRSLLKEIDANFKRFDSTPEAKSRDEFYQRAYNMISSPAAKKAFNIQEESADVRDKYGRNSFGQGCLLARRLVEAGVRFVTVTHGGWDTHSDNAKSCKERLVPPVDQGMAALLVDLEQRGLLKDTLVVWMGEFGRTAQINPLAGRDHWPNTGCAVFAGAGVPGGQLVGETDVKGADPKDRKISPEDIATTLYGKLGVQADKVVMTPSGRPSKLVDNGTAVKELG
ncbi:MAG TPA: DUF1501 domain-containing protein [Chthonomonadaceae bacterium]|nr:DUF1501 domain-containing protein [Chthonomonadaceae bacterium]